MNAARYCFLLLALLFRKIANTRISHRERSNHENTYTLLYFAGILFKSETTERKEHSLLIVMFCFPIRKMLALILTPKSNLTKMTGK